MTVDNRKPCSLCIHPCRADIDAELSKGTSVREVARRYAVAKSAVGRHRVHLLDPSKRELAETKAQLAVATVEARGSAPDRRGELTALRSTVLGIMSAHGGNPSALLACADRLLKIIGEDRAEDVHEAGDVLHPAESAWRLGAFSAVAPWITGEHQGEARRVFNHYLALNVPLETSPAVVDLTPSERRERILELLRRSDVLLAVIDSPACRGAILTALGVSGEAADGALSACLREWFKRVEPDDGVDRSRWWVPRDGPVPGGGQPVDAPTGQAEAPQGHSAEVAADGVPALLGNAIQEEEAAEGRRLVAVQIARDFAGRKETFTW